MKASSFYTHQTPTGTALRFVSAKDWLDVESTLTDAIKERARAVQFKAEVGAIFFAESGVALIGTGEDETQKALAMAALSLPEGHYFCNEVLPHRAYLNWALAQYRYDAYKASGAIKTLFLPQPVAKTVLPQAEAVFLARDLINAPSNRLTPKMLAEVLSDLAHRFDARYQQWVGDDLQKEGFRAIYAVGQASAHEPRLARLVWGDEAHPKLSIVGKGVTFDSGGLDIKPSSNMRLMKKDMGGAAIAMALAEWIMATSLPVHLEVLIPAVENAIGSASYRPGDVIKMRNGLNVEIDNTDAEGRLILADAIDKACEHQPELLIDFSTLTGAARVAVGTEISALFSNDNALATALVASGDETEDYIWQLPLFKPYASLLDSKVADLMNSSASSYAGAITAALFLMRFVPEHTAWAHFDLMAWNVTSKPGRPEGGEAMSVLALMHYLNARYREDDKG